jgi:hypothetical protein
MQKRKSFDSAARAQDDRFLENNPHLPAIAYNSCAAIMARDWTACGPIQRAIADLSRDAEGYRDAEAAV